MRKGRFTYLKSWHNTKAMMLGLAILIAGFTPISQPLFSATTLDAAANTDCELAIATPVVSPMPVLNTSSNYCATQTTHFGGNAPSAIFLTIENLDANSIYVEIESATASPVDLLEIANIVGGTISAPMTPSPGVIRRTVTWAVPPTNVILNILWSQEDFGGNWQLSQAPITVPFDAVCDGSPPPSNQPTTNAPDPDCPASEVISIYGGTYPSIATNFDPNWGQSGHNQVNPNFDPGTGNVVLAYPNFNYQGTDLTPTNASSMDVLHLDVWTNANPSATTLQVSPVNFGTGPSEILVTIPFVQGEWTRVELPKSAFGGMTWDDIRQMKFAANGPGSTVPVDIYLDNIYFSTSECRTIPVTTNITFCVDYSCVAQTPGFAAQQIFFEGGPFAGFRPLTNTGNNIWCGTFALPEGEVRYNFFYAGAAGAGGPENLNNLDRNFCASMGPGGLKRTYSVVAGSPKTLTYAWESCSSTPNCPQPPAGPTEAAPTPTCLQENVISMFSDSYTNVGVDTWLTVWSSAAGGGIVPVAGNNTRLYTNVDFLGIETTGGNLIDATEMAFFHIDIWTPNMTTFRVKLVDFGANGIFQAGDDSEGEIAFTPTQSGWNSYKIPLTSFQAVGLQNKANIAQLILSGIPVGQGTLYVDNVYFSKTDCEQTCDLVISCNDLAVNFNDQPSIGLEASQLVTVSNGCGIQSINLSPDTIFDYQEGETVPVFVTVTDNSGNSATCVSQVTSGELPFGWSQDADGVGCPEGNAIAYNSSNGTWTASSTNCYYTPPFTSDATAFAQYSLCGDGSITAQVTGISGSSLGWAGVVMRKTNDPGAKKAQLTTNMSNFSRREFRSTTNGAAFPQQFPSQNKRWLRIVRSGNQFVMYISTDGFRWNFAGSQNIQMESCIEIGLVVTNYASNSTVTATFDNVNITGGNSQPDLDGRNQALVNIHDQQGLRDIKVFPNPTAGELNIALNGYEGRSVTLDVYNTVGQLLHTERVDEVQNSTEILDLSSVPSGMYLIRVSSEGLPAEMKRVTVAR